jgi:signal transduction histidine kinase
MEEKTTERSVDRPIDREEGRIRLEVSDRGVGFDVEEVEASPGFGISGIQERARMFEGEMNVESTPGEGTRIEVLLPLIRQEDPTESAWFWSGKAGPGEEESPLPNLPPEKK